MALGSAHVISTNVKSAKFTPEIWSDEITATYKKNRVMANLVKSVSVKGKKGDVVHLPKPVRGTATAKAANTAVTFIAESGTGVAVNLDQHWTYGRVIEDIVEKQAMSSLRRFYTEDAGEALNRKVEDLILQQFRSVKGGSGTAAYTKAVIGSDGSTDYTSGTPNQAALTDAAIRKVIQTLDDNDVPQSDRFLVIPPVTRNTLMGLARFTEQGFTGETGKDNVIRNGRMGSIYGVDVYVTSMCETATGAARIALLGHRDAVVLCEQMSPRVQTQPALDFLGDMLVADVIFGCAELRDEAAVAIAVVA